MADVSRAVASNQRTSRGNLGQEACRIIRQRILRGEYPLGYPLSRRKLAADFGMSFSPLTEAMQILESEGLVETVPRVGTRVRIPNSQQIRGHCVIREALECQSARMFAEKASPGERQELQERAAELDALYLQYAGRPHDPDEFLMIHDRHFALHLRIAEVSNYSELCDALSKNQTLVVSWMCNTGSGFRDYPSPRWHRQLAASLAAGSADEAEQAMREHVRHGESEILRRVTLFIRQQGY